MSVEAFARALYAPLSGNRKVLLLGLANHAAPDGSNAYPAVATLAAYACVDERTVQRNLRTMQDEGFIADEGNGTRGQRRWRVCFEKWEGGKVPPPASEADGVASGAAGGGIAAPPEPSIEPSKRTGDADRARPAVDTVPDEFPDELRPHARIVLKLLREVATQHGARRVTPLAVGRVIMARPHKPLVKSAHDFAAWAADPPRPIRDVVASYRTWLDRERDLQGVEPVKGQSREKGGARTGRFDRKVTRDG